MRRAEPERTCVGCRERAPKGSLLRLVRASAGVTVDEAGRRPGRGAYVHRDRGCVRTALRVGSLARALRVALTAEEAARLRSDIEEELA